MFIQSVFIRKNSPYLQEKLKEMGYKYSTTGGIKSNNIVVSLGCIFDIYPVQTIIKGFNNCIDCGNNEELFLAIAALRDDSDYMQWFTDGEKWIQNKQNDIEVIKYGPGNPINFHKATINELIEYFK
jgi:hypothetical protein